MELSNIPAYEKGKLNVIVETPKGSQIKYTYDPGLKVFKLGKFLPIGTVFPFDFGFIPNTKGEDGDPLDILIIMDEPASQGCLVECRLLGVLKANQKERDEKEVRNDRFVAVASRSILYKDVASLKELNANLTKEIEHFFIDYNKHAGKVFTPLGWTNADEALELLKRSLNG